MFGAGGLSVNTVADRLLWLDPAKSVNAKGAVDLTAANTEFLSAPGDPDAFDFDRTDAFTVQGWINPDDATANVQGLWSKMGSSGTQRGYNLFLRGSNAGTGQGFNAVLRHDITGPDQIQVFFAWTFSANTWHHVVMTYDGSGDASGLKLIVDGVELSGTVLDNTLTGTIQTTEPFRLGTRKGTSDPFDGQFDQVAIHARALSVSEAGDFHNNGNGLGHSELTATQKTDLRGFYELDEPSAGTGTVHRLDSNLSNRLRAALFDASNVDRLENSSSDFDPGTESFSVELWVQGTTEGVVLNKGNKFSTDTGWSVTAVVDLTKIRFRARESNSNEAGQTIDVDLTQLTHVVAVINRSTDEIQIYANGSNAGATDGGGGSPDNLLSSGGSISDADPIRFGVREDLEVGISFGGLVAPARIWKGRALTASEIGTLYNNGTPLFDADLPSGFTTNLLASWDLQESGGSRADAEASFTLTEQGTIPGVPAYGSRDLQDNNTVPSAEGLASTPADPGNPVFSWIDQIANLEFSNSTIPNEPTFQDSPNRLVFDGIDDRLDHTTGPIVGKDNRTAWTLFLAVNLEPAGSATDGPRALYEESTTGEVLRVVHVADNTADAEKVRFDYQSTSGGSVDSVLSTVDVADSSNHVIAVRFDNGSVSLFVDGSPAGTGTVDSGPISNSATPVIGRSVGNGFIEGQVRDVFAVGQALTDSEISTLSDQLKLG